MTDKPKIERRAAGSVEVRAAEDGAGLLTGYAAVFNVETVIGDFFREIIRPGAFTRALAEKQDVVAWVGHGAEPMPLGRSSSGTLRLAEDDTGLAFELDVPDTQLGRDTLTSIKRGDISGMSFAFWPVRETWSGDGKAEPKLRELLDLDLFDVSPVIWPAYQGTSVGVRSAADVLAEHAEDGQTPAAAPGGEQALVVLVQALDRELDDTNDKGERP